MSRTLILSLFKGKLTRFAFFFILISSCTPKLNDDTVEKLCSNYSTAELAYFGEIAFGAEADVHFKRLEPNGSDRNQRWYEDVIIKVEGQPSDLDKQMLDEIIAKLNAIIDPIEIKIFSNQEDYNVEMWFIDHEREVSLYGGELKGKYYGAEATVSKSFGKIKHAKIIIPNHIESTDLRDHVIREELTQSLGLYRDSDTYEKSTFNQSRQHVTEFHEIDVKLIEILYNNNLPTNITRDQFLEAVNSCDK